MIAPDDGLVDVDPLDYVSPFRRWPAHEQRALRHVRGRVLDVGCGAGRVALHLEPRGHDVVSIDVAPGALRTARERGASDVRGLAASEGRTADLPFDTILMFGNNAGLLRDAPHARWLLRRFARPTGNDGAVVASTQDPYDTTEPLYRSYHQRNRARGRLGGQIRLRVRYRWLVTPWFDHLFTSVAELERFFVTPDGGSTGSSTAPGRPSPSCSGSRSPIFDAFGPRLLDGAHVGALGDRCAALHRRLVA
ncbi:MAG: class I SAM-dependent methyltransferase [Actinomycetota bacterium]